MTKTFRVRYWVVGELNYSYTTRYVEALNEEDAKDKIKREINVSSFHSVDEW